MGLINSNPIFRNGTTYKVSDVIDKFYISSGQYTGAFRAYEGGKILWYFSNLAVYDLADSLAGTNKTDYVLPYIKKQMDYVAIARADSQAYTLGNMIIAQERIFECTTAGTTAGSEPAGYASAAIDGTVTDGTAVFTMRERAYGSPDYVLYDTNAALDGLAVPDSTDSYASTLFSLIWKYTQITGSVAWLAGASNNRGLSYQAILDGMYQANIRGQFDTDDLVFTFQNETNLGTDAAYDIRFTYDNIENLNGLQALENLYGASYVNDATRLGYAQVDIAKILPAIVGLYDVTEGAFLRFSGATQGATDSVINRWEVQRGVLYYLNDDDLTEAQKLSMITYADNLIPKWWTKREIDATTESTSTRNLNLLPLLYEAEKGGNLSVVSESIYYLEKMYLQRDNVAMSINDVARLIKVKQIALGI